MHINNLKYCKGTRNWGDYIATFIYQGLTKKKPNLLSLFKKSKKEHYLTIGSVLSLCDNKSIIWGSGFISEDDALGVTQWDQVTNVLLCTPKKICAVRGPLTRDKLISMGIQCPKIYGDPAILMPMLYKAPYKTKYKLGVIPHYIDKKSPLIMKLKKDPNIKMIDICKSRLEKYTGLGNHTTRFIDEICECEKIISSSLHGLIAADTYGIPANRVIFSGNVVGNGFKFYDYFMSVARTGNYKIKIDNDDSLYTILKKFRNYSLSINCESLLEAAPFDVKL